MSGRRIPSLIAGATLLALVSMVPNIARAQGSARDFSFGVKGGWTSTDTRGGIIDDGNTIDFDRDNGFAFGVVGATEVHPNVSVQGEALFVRKQVAADLGDASAAIRIDYFEVPVLANLHGTRGSNGVVPFAVVGPAFSFRVRAEQRLEIGGVVNTEDIKDDVTGVDVGVVLGGGIELLQDWGAFTIEGRYTLGLRSLDGSGEDDIKLGSFAVLGGVIF